MKVYFPIIFILGYSIFIFRGTCNQHYINQIEEKRNSAVRGNSISRAELTLWLNFPHRQPLKNYFRISQNGVLSPPPPVHTFKFNARSFQQLNTC